MGQKLSLRGYSRKSGYSYNAIRNHIKKGKIVRDEDGWIDEDQANAVFGISSSDTREDPTNYDKARRPKDTGQYEDPPGVKSKEDKDPEIDQNSLRALLDSSHFLTKAEAEAAKENYLALQRRLEYERAASELVPVETAVQKVAEEYAVVRSKLLSLPTELAPKIAQETGADAKEVQELLSEGITQALEELSADQQSEVLQEEN